MLRQALDAVAAPALIIDAQVRERPVVYANAAAGRALGLHPNELIGRSLDSLGSQPFDPSAPGPWVPRASQQEAAVQLWPAPLYEQPGKASYWLLTASEPPAGSGASSAPQAGVTSTTGIFAATDVWARTLLDDRTDVVTGIPGRNALLDVLFREWARARREQQRISAIVFRIDALESYQSLFGRHSTEACIRKVAHAITNSLQRATDYCARAGHDRFAVLICGSEEERVSAFAERIAQRVRDLAIHHPRSQLARYVTVSWSLASEIPSALAEEPGILEDAEARVSGTPSRESLPGTSDLSADAG